MCGAEHVSTARQSQQVTRWPPLIVPQMVWGASERGSATFEAPKTKLKTRPTTNPGEDGPSHDSDNTEALSTITDSVDLKPHVEVNRETVRLLTRMFAPASDTKVNKSSVKWDDLVAALMDAGFQATANGGSAVTFKSMSGQGSIVFHRPHPDPTVDMIMLRSMGKRLAKWFGWEADTFVERGKI